MVDSANGFPEDESEFDKTGLTEMPAVKIKPPRVAQNPDSSGVQAQPGDRARPQPPPVIGEVVYFHVDPACMTNGYIDMRKLAPIGRLSGFQYVTLGNILDRKFDDGQPR
jgi:flavin reductase (DIM6/NTAB) family NADH-FMN oxidoreductase RutF